MSNISKGWRLVQTSTGDLELKQPTKEEMYRLLKLSEDCKFTIGTRSPCSNIIMYRIICKGYANE